jgi:hypothetical protein
MQNDEPEATEADIVDNYRLDHLYTYAFRNGAGKYFTVVSHDDWGTAAVVDFEHPYPSRNKIKTRLTFIKSDDGGRISEIDLKRFKFYKNKGYVECREHNLFVRLLCWVDRISAIISRTEFERCE